MDAYFEALRPGLDKRTWNALIGVITAIVGNVLISFALNLQRYAHIRLRKEKLERSRTWKHPATQPLKRPEYGTIAGANGTGRRVSNGQTLHPEVQTLLEEGGLPSRPQRRESELSRRTSSAHDDADDDEQKSYLRSPYWWAGIFLMTVGEAGNFLAYGFAPASIVSPLGVVALISNCIIAPCLLHERFRQRDFWGVLIAIAGAVTIVLSAKSNEKKMGPNEIWHAITRWEFELYLGITAAAILILAWASKRYGQKTILIDLGLVGLFGEYTALSTKGIASLLSDKLWRVITFPVTYLLVLVLITTALMQIRYINRALQRFPSTQVIPIQFVLFTISVITGSAVLYREFESTTADHIGRFVGGCLMTFLGVYLITRGRPASNDDMGMENEDGEEHISLVDEEASRTAPGHRLSIDNNTTTPNLTLSGPISRQNTQASGRSASRLSAASLSAASLPPQVWDSSAATTPPENSWMHTPEHLGPALFNPTQSNGIVESEIAASAPDRSSSLQPSNYPFAEEPRPRSVARRSMSRIFPNPLVTPLSSSLNGIVADSLRHGIDSHGRRIFRRGQDAPSRPESQVLDDSIPVMQDPNAAAPGSSDPLLSRPALDDTETENARSSRPRTLGTSLRALFRPSRLRNGARSERGNRVSGLRERDP